MGTTGPMAAVAAVTAITWALTACSEGGELINDAHVIVDGLHAMTPDCRSEICLHNENTDLAVFDGATYLVHRTALSQVLGPNSSLRVSRSDDHGRTWKLLAVLPAINGRDLRDPCFYVIDGKLAIKALTRLPVTSLRDSNVDTIAVGTVSPDGGATWSPLAPIGPETWSYWRIRDDPQGVHYTAAYEDGDKSVKLFVSVDGTTPRTPRSRPSWCSCRRASCLRWSAWTATTRSCWATPAGCAPRCAGRRRRSRAGIARAS
jgi:hypothetical protein